MKPWRSGVRALLVDPADRTLLIRYDLPPCPWAPPGGGLEGDETDERALRRELREEVGLEGFELGPCIWRREHEFPLDPFRGQRERIYLVRVSAFEPEPQIELRSEGVSGFAWWKVDEIAVSSDVFAPRRLAQLFWDLLAHGPPSETLDVGV